MRQTKTISLSESQRAWLKEFSEKHHFKESEVVQMLINKASIDNILQEILVDKITAKKEGIKKTEVTSDNVQIVKEKDASKPIPRSISANKNIPQKENDVVTNEELDALFAETKQKSRETMR